jgi:sulfite reductase (ferredoxin)
MADAQKLSWKEVLADHMPPPLAEEIDTYETQMELRRQGTIEERIFAEIRLRRGAYGQRYDNGMRYDGEKSQAIPFPRLDLLKGPDTKWDAPGMQRIKIPFGGLNAAQMEALADVAEEYSNGILHITTRQDVQLHFVSIDDTPDMHRRLAAVGITTREACGNSVRNVTACPLSGVCRDEAFDVTPYAAETAKYLLGHRDVQDFGRKFKPAFSGCKEHACGLTSMHDLGLIATTRVVDGVEQRGFEMYVGGGLGAVPHLAKLLDEFVTFEELLPLIQAIARVFARLGEKRNRNKARIKFLVANLGIEEFRRLVLEERASLEEDPAWRNWLPEIAKYEEAALPAPFSGEPLDLGTEFEQWKSTNVYQQRQAGFVTVTVALPLGDLTAPQIRGLADLCRTFNRDTARTTVDQNIVVRWLHEADLPAFYQALKKLKLHSSGAASIVDVTACPGTDTCKLGIASSRGLAGELRQRLAAKGWQYDEAIKDIRVKISGCFNSCGQHTVAEIGFYGASRTVGNHRVPHFHLILGGQWDKNAANYGQSLGAIPSKRAPEVVDKLISLYMEGKRPGETFRDYVVRVGKKAIKEQLKPYTELPTYAENPSFYTDWADAREFTIGDVGVGECAGEVVSLTDFGITMAESLHFEAQVLLDEHQHNGNGDLHKGAGMALEAMLKAAQGLIKVYNPDISNDPDTIVHEFRANFYQTQLFFDRFVGGKFASYFFNAYEERHKPMSLERAQQLMEETRLFIEAAHVCSHRMLELGITNPMSFARWKMTQAAEEA